MHSGRGTERGPDAGFDGLEPHAANGNLFEQFLPAGINTRADIYVGSFENRTRFPLNATRAVIYVWGSEKFGVRVGPSCPWGRYVRLRL